MRTAEQDYTNHQRREADVVIDSLDWLIDQPHPNRELQLQLLIVLRGFDRRSRYGSDRRG